MTSQASIAYSPKRTLALWLAVTVPAAALAWGIVPLVVARSSAPPVLVSLLALAVSATWTALVGWWALRQDGVPSSKESIESALGLTPPAAAPKLWKRLGRLPLLAALALVAYAPLVLWHAAAHVGPFMIRVSAVRQAVSFIRSLQPGYVPPLSLADPAFGHAYWFVPLALAAWGLNAFVAEELFFRGLLLPRLRSRDGRIRIASNALLYLAYCLAVRPFSAPARLVWGFAAAWLTRRGGSVRPALALRAVEGFGVAALASLAVSARPLPPLTVLPPLPHIARQPKPTVWFAHMRQAAWSSLPKYQQAASNPWQLDLRGKELSKHDLGGRAPDLLMSTFDATTVWPERLPTGFSPSRVMELGKNPGLGVRRLHGRGLTGRGVGIGIVDNPLLTSHIEIAPRLRWYEEITTGRSEPAQMHGPAVASIAVGQSLGVAPDAGLYFVAVGDNPRRLLSLYQGTALGVHRLVEVNRRLPAAEKIRVISLSQGFSPGQVGYLEATQAIRRARSEGIFVIYCSMEADTPLAFHGLGRYALADPERTDSYGPGLWWTDHFLGRRVTKTRLLAPMDARTAASPTGDDHYVFYRQGGWSWVAPYIAGLYALTLQVDPQLTGERFWALALETGRTRMVEERGRRLPLGRIVDPEALIDAVARNPAPAHAGRRLAPAPPL